MDEISEAQSKWGNCWDDPIYRPTPYTYLMNYLVTNKEEMILFIVLVMLGLGLLFGQMDQLRVLVQQTINNYTLSFRYHYVVNIKLIIMSCVKIITLFYNLFGYAKQERFNANINYFLNLLLLLIFNHILVYISVYQMDQSDVKYQFYYLRYAPIIDIILFLVNLIAASIGLYFQFCKQSIDSVQYCVIGYTILTDIGFSLSCYYFYQYLKAENKFGTQSQKTILKWAFILILFSTLYRLSILLFRASPLRYNLSQWKSGLNKEELYNNYYQNISDPNWGWSVQEFAYYFCCDFLPRLVFFRMFKIDGRSLNNSHQ